MAGESLSFGDDACFEAAVGAEGVEGFGDVAAAGTQEMPRRRAMVSSLRPLARMTRMVCFMVGETVWVAWGPVA